VGRYCSRERGESKTQQTRRPNYAEIRDIGNRGHCRFLGSKPAVSPNSWSVCEARWFGTAPARRAPKLFGLTQKLLMELGPEVLQRGEVEPRKSCPFHIPLVCLVEVGYPSGRVQTRATPLRAGTTAFRPHGPIDGVLKRLQGGGVATSGRRSPAPLGRPSGSSIPGGKHLGAAAAACPIPYLPPQPHYKLP
jgi:hypothetical protein